MESERSMEEDIDTEETEHNDSKVMAHIRGVLSRFAQGDATDYNELVGKLNQSGYLSPDDMALLVMSLKGLSGAVASIDIVRHETLLQAVFVMDIWKYDPDIMDVLVDLIILLDRVHKALIKITNLVPLAPLRLCPILLRRMPDIFVTEPVMAVYVENMLRLESGPIGEFCGGTMMQAVVETGEACIFDVELKDMDSDDFDDGFVLLNQANIFAEKLDSLMVLTCRHIRFCAENGRLSKVFNTLLHCFHSSVLNTQRSKFAHFAFMLADIFYCNTEKPLTRMSSVAYLASYLARANFIEGPMIAWALRRLVDWCVDYCREMLDDPCLKSVIFGCPLQLIFQHPLDPLKVCLPSFVEEFLQQAKAASLFTASEHFLFKNLLKSSEAFGGAAKLDMFFPFDPFLLKKSDRFIKPIFLYWSNVGQSKRREGDQSAKFCMFEMVSKGLSRFASLCPRILFGST
ncbi:hypothetical protein MKX03_021836 [Papaver bracteatum]|nr:hypothetical protein MKX03_021836 [Papaver bracteatum]